MVTGRAVSEKLQSMIENAQVLALILNKHRYQ